MGTKLYEVLDTQTWAYYANPEEFTLSDFHDAIEAIQTIENRFKNWMTRETHENDEIWVSDHRVWLESEDNDEAMAELFWHGHNASYLIPTFGADVRSKIYGWRQ